jgi:hypothetical protein
MDTTKVSELVRAFKQLTPEERQLALKQMLPAAGVQQTSSAIAAWGEQAALIDYRSLAHDPLEREQPIVNDVRGEIE